MIAKIFVLKKKTKIIPDESACVFNCSSDIKYIDYKFELNNFCYKECPEGFVTVNFKCYEKCSFADYITTGGEYICTDSPECPEGYKKSIFGKIKCVKDSVKNNEEDYRKKMRK